MNGQRLPHSVRLAVLILRLILGLDFFYIGWSAVFRPDLARELGARSLAGLYAWAAGAFAGTPLHPLLGWAFLAVGACLIAGLATRLASFVGIALALISYAPGAFLHPFAFTAFASDAVFAAAALLVLIAADAGSYLGLDRFFHVHFAGKHA